jgi:drug/metabolite transporter (DMT)-like permease
MTQWNEIIKPNRFIIYAVILITIFEATGQLCLKEFQLSNTHSYYFLILGILFYIIVCTLLCYCYKYKAHLGRVNLMWSCMSIVFVIIIGYVFLQEEIKNHDFAAIFFALLAIYFANMD